MPKARLIRPEIWTDAKFVGLSPLARLLFIGMWNFACDNGHLDNNLLELKMRILPADSCDTGALLDEVLATGMVAVKDTYLKIPRLAGKQPLDLRYLQFCDSCDDDPDSHYSRSDKKDGRGDHASGSRAARGAPASPLGRGGGDGGGDGGGSSAGGSTRAKPRKRPSSTLPEDWQPTPKHQELASELRLDLERSAARFKDHAAANDRRQVDWDAAFRQWLRGDAEYGKARATPTSSASRLPHVSEIEPAPSGMTDEEYDAWEQAQAAKRAGS